MSSREFQARLARRARKAGVTLKPELGGQLEVYYRLLSTWNQKINLTGLKLDGFEPDALDRLLVEPLVAATHVKPSVRKVIDIGSGGGSPAIPLTLALNETSLLMVESKTRKGVFLREVIRALGITRAEIVSSRFEQLLASPTLHEAHDLLTIRAVRVEARQLIGLQAFVKPGGELFLFRTSLGIGAATTVPPLLVWKASYPLLDQTSNTLVVLEKPATRIVSRETSA